jgi:hypothetical protein
MKPIWDDSTKNFFYEIGCICERIELNIIIIIIIRGSGFLYIG